MFSRVENRVDEVNKTLAEHLKISREKMQEGSGKERIAKIKDVLGNSLVDLFKQGVVINIGTAIASYKLIENLSEKWLGDINELALIGKSPPGNVTTEMSLSLCDTADVVRKYPEVVDYLEHADDKAFWDGLKIIPGGEEAYDALSNFFKKYGIRCTGEIDITRQRWREAPTLLIPALLNSVRNSKPGAHRFDFEEGRKESQEGAGRLLERLKNIHGGFIKVKIMRRLIKAHRAVIGLRESPKFHLVKLFDIAKAAILEEAADLTREGIIDCPEEIFWFSLQEIGEIVENRSVDRNIIKKRKEKFEHDSKLTPPRIMTSEGEILTAKSGVNIPVGTLSGSPASAGIIEGRARVVLKLEEAELEEGDILVAPYTDPAWTPLFPLSSGLVAEVGGLMTHGAVVAREHGIPAVLGVDNATKIIKNSAYIRVNGSEGYVEILEK